MMIFGMTAFTFAHTLISLLAIVAGAVVVYGLLTSKRLEGWTMLYLVLAGATSLTGFGFSADHFLPSHVLGIISLVLLAGAIFARYVFRLIGAWAWVFVGCVVITLYLDVFVGIVQAFQKIPVLAAVAPTQSEPPFAIIQIATLVAFAALGITTAIRYRRAAPA